MGCNKERVVMGDTYSFARDRSKLKCVFNALDVLVVRIFLVGRKRSFFSRHLSCSSNIDDAFFVYSHCLSVEPRPFVSKHSEKQKQHVNY